MQSRYTAEVKINDTQITANEYGSFQFAYDTLNDELFGGELPPVLITLQRHAGARGYFAPERFNGRGGKSTTHEIALNPDTFDDQTDAEILSTLAHEMCHVWQQCYGRAPRKCYHDKQFASKMKEIGLQTTATGEPGGKETGPKMTHYIITGGRYDRAAARLLALGFKLQWQSDAAWGKGDKEKSKSSKTKFTCPNATRTHGANRIPR